MNNIPETKPTVKSFLVELSVETFCDDKQTIQLVEQSILTTDLDTMNLKIKSIILVEKHYIK